MTKVATKKIEMDLSTGPIFKKLILYAIPFMITNILQTLFKTMDIAVLGVFCGNGLLFARVNINTLGTSSLQIDSARPRSY